MVWDQAEAEAEAEAEAKRTARRYVAGRAGHEGGKLSMYGEVEIEMEARQGVVWEWVWMLTVRNCWNA